MKNLLIVFFTVWFGLGVFIVARWYRCRQAQSSGADGGRRFRRGSFTGTGTLLPSVLGYVIDGLTYINIHSSFADGGEVRGQVIR